MKSPAVRWGVLAVPVCGFDRSAGPRTWALGSLAWLVWAYFLASWLCKHLKWLQRAAGVGNHWSPMCEFVIIDATLCLPVTWSLLYASQSLAFCLCRFGSCHIVQRLKATPLLGIYLEKTLIRKDTCTSVSIAARRGSNLSVHWQMNGQRRCGVYIYIYIHTYIIHMPYFIDPKMYLLPPLKSIRRWHTSSWMLWFPWEDYFFLCAT